MISLTAMVDLWQQAKSFWRPNAFHFGSNEPIEKEYSVSMMSSSLQYESEDVIATLDSYGNTTHWQQDAFGRAVPASTPWEPMSSSAPKEHLTGKMFDDVTGLYYFHARWYDPEVGRFVSRDPLIALDDHTFSGNDPANTTDSTGLICEVYTYRTIAEQAYSGCWLFPGITIDQGHEWIEYAGKYSSVGFWPNRNWSVLRNDPGQIYGWPKDYKWDTKQRNRGKMRWGTAEGQPCKCVTCDQINSCLDAVPNPGWRSCDIRNNCRRFVKWALKGCCLSKSNQ